MMDTISLVDSVDLGVLIEVVRLGLERYSFVPVKGVIAEYNIRSSQARIFGLSSKSLETCAACVGGSVVYGRNSRPVGIRRGGRRG